MEIFAFGVMFGIIFGGLFVAVAWLREEKNDSSVAEGECDKSDSSDVDSGDDSRLPRSNTNRINWASYEEGSEERKEELDKLVISLTVMQMATGLCRTEKETLEDAISFIKHQIDRGYDE